jgi:hypothetical protein
LIVGGKISMNYGHHVMVQHDNAKGSRRVRASSPADLFRGKLQLILSEESLPLKYIGCLLQKGAIQTNYINCARISH